MSTQAVALIIDGTVLPVRVDPIHECTLTTAQVAEGYGVSPDNIRKTLQRHGDELLSGKHFYQCSRFEQCGTNSHARDFQGVTTNWTKRGIVRLGFFIRSERAKRFRDLAEDLVIGHMEEPAAPAVFSPVADLARKMEAFSIGSERDVEVYRAMAKLQLELASPAHPEPKPQVATRQLVQWLRGIAKAQAEAGVATKSYSLPELLRENPPVPRHLNRPDVVLGKRLQAVTGVGIPLDNGLHAYLNPNRTRHQRLWVLRVGQEM